MKLIKSLKNYFKRLLYPVYLFPLKLITYTIYYIFLSIIKILIAIVSLIIDAIVYPFKSLKHFFKALFMIGIGLYLIATLFVVVDYLYREYGYIGKFVCSVDVNPKLKKSVVRVVGGFSEGSGFFISENQILTNFHVIANEPSPKIIFPDGKFTTPIKITGNKEADLAILHIDGSYPDMVMKFLEPYELRENEKLVSGGYPMGTDLAGVATTVTGRFITFRESKHYPVSYLHTDINVVEGMSGGPLVDLCGMVVGVNTMSLSGQSLFISAYDVKRLLPSFSDQEVKKIDVDPSLSPEDAVKAFYTYLKARRMEDGFNLLSEVYLQKTNFEEWTNRFTDILDVDVINVELYENSKDTVFVKFSTKNWNDGEVDYHYYEGTWKTTKEDEVYKMLKSNIKEVTDPNWDWFWGS